MRLSLKGVFLSLILMGAIFSLFGILDIQAQEKLVSAKSIGFEETTVIEFKNEEQSKSNINTIRMWLGQEFSFKSFKTEKGWTGQKTPQGVIVFSTSNPLKPGEVVKFGVKTDKPKPGINWKALDENEKEIGTAKTLVSDSSTFEQEKSVPGDTAIFEESSFRLVPEKPSVGSSMRVTGDNFGANQKLDLYLNNNKLETFETDDNGHFMITSKIPENQAAGRVDFIIKDSSKNEKSISLRIGESTDRMSTQVDVPLTISATPPIVYRGDTVKVTGTGMPGGTVTATVKDAEGNVVTTIAVDVSSKGEWEYETLIAPDTPFGKRTAEITDGTQTILRSWTVESSKVIELTPEKVKFEAGETVSFNGTALPNKEIEITVEDPQGNEFYGEIITVGPSGEVSFQFPTLISSPEGTYIVFASQEESTEIFLVGLGQLPKEQLIVKTDKLNYSTSESAILEIQGPPSATVSLLVVDPSDKNKFSETITLQPEGRAQYELDLAGYGSGVYTAVITRGNSQAQDVFSVGLQTGSGEISVRTTKDTYGLGESILVLGSSGENILLTLTLLDPDDEVVKTKETFTNKDGVFSESSFRIPLDGKIGTWTINAKSGPNFDIAELIVVGDIEEGMVVFVKDISPSPTGKIATITGYGAAVTQNVVIKIFDENNEEIDELTVTSTGVGDFTTLWIVPSDLPPGVYKVTAKDAFNESQTELVLE